MRWPIYLDYNATTPVHPEVVDTVELHLRESFGNPSSSHVYGQRAHEAIALARQQMAALIGSRPEEVVFTSCASEANNMAILGSAKAMSHRGRHLITSAVEHPSVMQPFLHLQEEGWDLSIVPVDSYGRVDPEDVRQAIRPDTVLVSIMHANNEVGTIQPIREIAQITRERDVLLHVDAAQSVGKIPVSVDALGVDLLTIAGHKFYAPKGVGALYIREGIQLSPTLFGAGQEHGRRTGTENVAYIAGIGTAAQLTGERLTSEEVRLRNLRDLLHARLEEEIAGLKLNGHPKDRLPNTLNVSFPDVDGRALLSQESSDIAASVGSACHAKGEHISGVLGAMGLSSERARGALRLSVGQPTTEEEVERAALALIDGWCALRKVVSANKATARSIAHA